MTYEKTISHSLHSLFDGDYVVKLDLTLPLKELMADLKQLKEDYDLSRKHPATYEPIQYLEIAELCRENITDQEIAEKMGFESYKKAMEFRQAMQKRPEWQI